MRLALLRATVLTATAALAASGATAAAAQPGPIPAVTPAAAPAAASAAAPPLRTPATTAARVRPPATAEPGPDDDGVTVTEVDVVVPGGAFAAAPPAAPDLTAPGGAGPLVAAQTLERPGRVATEPLETGPFQTLGVTWPGEVEVGALDVQVQTRSAGAWSAWVPLELPDTGPDAGTPDAEHALRGGTDPLWVPDADAVRLSFPDTGAAGPAGLRLTLIDVAQPGEPTVGPAAPAAAPVALAGVADGSVAAMAAAPQMFRRADWGARAASCAPGLAASLVGVVLHHTAGPNTYSTVGQAMQQLRGDQAYHMDARGWCDLGYNFVVDKWGNVYEGRGGSVDQPVIGVHAGGFNTGTVGISMLGSYGDVAPSAAVRDSVARLAAWRLGAYYRDPGALMTYRTGGGENSRYPAGTAVTLPRVFGHRDVGQTACPGDGGYGALPAIRHQAKQLSAPSLVEPSASATRIDQGGDVTVRAGAVADLSWQLDVADRRTGVVLRTLRGVASEAGGGLVATWDGNNGVGAMVGPGPYALQLTATHAFTGVAARSWTAHVEVTGSQNPPTVAPVPLGGDLTFVPITPARLTDTRLTGQSLGPDSRMDVQVAGRGGIPASARAVALNVTSVAPSATTFLRVWPAGQPEPGASAMNADPARTAGAGIMVGVGGEGKVSIRNNLGSTHVVVDVTGYYTAAATDGFGYEELATGARVLDTRTAGGAMGDGERRTVQVAGVGGIPTSATAVAVNVTSVGSAAPGNIAAFPAGGPVPGTASVNHMPGQDVSNRTVVPLSGGRLDLRLAGGRADVVIDVLGWFGPGAGLRFTPMAPVRAFDTRTTSALGAGQTRTFDLSGIGTLPADARVAAIALAATGQDATATFATLWRDGVARPATSDLNTGAGRDQVNLTLPSLTARRVQLYNNAGRSHYIGDLFGYFR